MDTTIERISNSVWYNNNLIDLIEKKLTIYRTSFLVNKRHPSQGYKEDITRMYNGLEAIKDTLATMNIDLQIEYNNYKAIFHDLTNDFTIEIESR